MSDDFDELSTEELAARAATRDRDAVRALFARIRPWVVRTLARDQFDAEDVQDIAQEALIKILNNLERYDPTRPFRPWAITIVRRERTGYIRKKRPRKAAEEDAAWNTVVLTDGASPDLSGEVAFLTALRGCVGRLSPNRRSLMWAFLVDGYTIAELEREYAELRHSVRRWIKHDAVSVYRCLGLHRELKELGHE